MRKIDAFLSRKAQEAWPTAVVWKEEASSSTLRLDGSGSNSGQVFILQRESYQDFILGRRFQDAKAELEVLVEREMAKRATDGADRDLFLTRKAQDLWPTAVVYKENASSETLRLDGSGNNGGLVFILQREGFGDIILGHQPGEAKAGLEALLASERSKRAGKEGV